ncbi:hypothetical protein HETIRDRAFT_170294 [Heterobasidion irregulare TC 32-1]|uniref:CcmS related domain-containing protein n=1 Tax=Heterobasidion irregulare (strain TC 32-1) TaxID=747525 RepID=W4KDA9_HETIT|nr:uncharacterized protein HETIRDRAFT_170294 [Heterobasidion irregulare TC 32-1]ETW83832.1 hypothetical protein HETIRDRAFT_170294 [Heterobasidion irregulare TC 32-1]
MPKNKKGKQKAQPQVIEEEEEDFGTILEDGEGAMSGHWEENAGPDEGWEQPPAAWGHGGGDLGPAENDGAEASGWSAGPDGGGNNNNAGATTSGWGPEAPGPPSGNWPSPASQPAAPRAPSGNQPWSNLAQGAGNYAGPSPATAPPPSLPMQRQPHALRHTTGLPSWQNWGAEAAAQARPTQRGAVNQGRVAFRETPSVIPYQYSATSTAPPLVPPSQQRSGRKTRKAPAQDPWPAQGEQGWGNTAQSQGAPNLDASPWQAPDQDHNDWTHQDPIGWGQDGQHQQQESQPQDQTWGRGQEGQRWQQENQTPQAEGWGHQDTGQNQWGNGGGAPDENQWNDWEERQQYSNSLAKAYVPRLEDPSSYPMPSRTMAYAMDNSPDAFRLARPVKPINDSGMSDYAHRKFVEAHGEGLRPADRALFGRERRARERIHWKFPHDKDPRVRDTLHWIQDKAHGLGALGARERGALFVNASYTPATGEPALDWLSYHEVVETRDKLIQESIGFYDPARQVIVFTLLPSASGNSVAMWRRKVSVPTNLRLAWAREIELAKAALMKDYPVYVDELESPIEEPISFPVPVKKKKGFFKRLFRLFRVQW